MSQRAGWYDDPENPENLRYFDGVLWTAHTTPRTSPTASQSTIGLADKPSSKATRQVPQPSAGGQGSAPQDAEGSDEQPGDRQRWGQQGSGQQGSGQPGQQGWGQQYEQSGGPYGSAPTPYGQQTQGGYPGGPASGSMPPAYASAFGLKTTPDGVPLASYGQRVGAWIIDFFVQLAVTSLLAGYWIWQFVQWYSRWLGDLMHSAAAGGAPAVDQATVQSQITGYVWPISLISFLVSVVYQVGFLTTKGATPGKMALGISVRLRSRPGNLSVVDALKRQLVYVGTSALNFVPIVGLFSLLIKVVDILWPLWDEHRQALHDKIAGTNVVIRRKDR